MYMYKHWNKSIWIHIEWPINKAFILPYPLYQWAFDVIMWNPHLRYGDPTANTEIKGSLSWVGCHMCINLCRYLKSLTTIGKVLRTGKNIWTLVSDWVIASLTDMMQKKQFPPKTSPPSWQSSGQFLLLRPGGIETKFHTLKLVTNLGTLGWQLQASSSAVRKLAWKETSCDGFQEPFSHSPQVAIANSTWGFSGEKLWPSEDNSIQQHCNTTKIQFLHIRMQKSWQKEWHSTF